MQGVLKNKWIYTKDEISKASDKSFHFMKHGESIANSMQRHLNQGHSMENSKANSQK